MIIKTAKYGRGYETPQGISEDKYYEFMYEFIDLAKVKGLTIRQAQKLFVDCSDAVLDSKLYDNKISNNNSSELYLKSIVDSLNKIIDNGIITKDILFSGNN